MTNALQYPKLMPFSARQFRVVFKNHSDLLFTNNIIRFIPIYKKGTIQIEIHIRDSVSIDMPTRMREFSNSCSDIILEQLDGNAKVSRTTCYKNCNVKSITHANLDYSSDELFPIWIIKAKCNSISTS